MYDLNNLPAVDATTIHHYELEARRLRAEALRDMITGTWAAVRGLVGHKHATVHPAE